MGKQQVQNWLGDIISYPSVVIEPETVEDIVSIMQDTQKYPSPVRAAGFNHSTTACAVADNGTLVGMRKMNRIIKIDSDTVTVQAGALYIDVAQELRKHKLQFYVNAEIGTLTAGSAACCGTKKSSMRDEFGEMGSYATVIKMVASTGELIEVTEEQPELLQVVRSSYGLLGIIYEVTFKVKPLQAMTIYHVPYGLDSFHKQLPALRARGDAMMMYVSPFTDTITVEFRRYRRDEDPQKASSWQMKLRNFLWSRVAPYFFNSVTNYIPSKPIRYFLIDRFNQFSSFLVVWVIDGKNILAPDQMIRFAEKPGNTRFTFSIWAFQEEEYPRIQRAYFDFCHEYYRSNGYRCNMMELAYRVNADTSSLFSYSFDGTVITIDPVSTGDVGWDEFLVAFNDFCSQNGGVPVFSQTKLLTRAQVQKAFGERLNTFENYRHRFDPTDRLLNDYFRKLLKDPSR